MGNLIEEYIYQAQQADSLLELNIDGRSQGYTLKTLAVALWALFHAESFEDGLLAVVNAGGDADTNAAVACALLGTKYGIEAIPERYVQGLNQRERLFDASAQLSKIARASR